MSVEWHPRNGVLTVGFVANRTTLRAAQKNVEHEPKRLLVRMIWYLVKSRINMISRPFFLFSLVVLFLRGRVSSPPFFGFAKNKRCVSNQRVFGMFF